MLLCLGQIESQNQTEEGPELINQVPELVAYKTKTDAEIKTEEGAELTTQVPELVAYKTKKTMLRSLLADSTR